jgi:hypothetical protein
MISYSNSGVTSYRTSGMLVCRGCGVIPVLREDKYSHAGMLSYCLSEWLLPGNNSGLRTSDDWFVVVKSLPVVEKKYNYLQCALVDNPLLQQGIIICSSSGIDFCTGSSSGLFSICGRRITCCRIVTCSFSGIITPCCRTLSCNCCELPIIVVKSSTN